MTHKFVIRDGQTECKRCGQEAGKAEKKCPAPYRVTLRK